jgi:hypothetical protein
LESAILVVAVIIILVINPLSFIETDEEKAERIGEEYLFNEFNSPSDAIEQYPDYSDFSSYNSSDRTYQVFLDVYTSLNDDGWFDMLHYSCYVDADNWNAYDGVSYNKN